LYPVYQFSRMLQTYAHGQSFGFNLNLFVREHAVDIARRMSGGKDYGTVPFLLFAGGQMGTFNPLYLVVLYDKTVHTCLEMYFSSTSQNGIAHVLYDTGQAVCTDVWMGIHQYGIAGSVLHKDMKNLFAVAALLASGEKFSVAVGSCASFAKGIVAFGVNLLGGTDTRQILFAGPDVLSALHNNGAYAKLNQSEGGKQSAGACSHDNGFLVPGNIGIEGGLVCL
jgi:hypothetical protein